MHLYDPRTLSVDGRGVFSKSGQFLQGHDRVFHYSEDYCSDDLVDLTAMVVAEYNTVTPKIVVDGVLFMVEGRRSGDGLRQVTEGAM